MGNVVVTQYFKQHLSATITFLFPVCAKLNLPQFTAGILFSLAVSHGALVKWWSIEYLTEECG